MFKMQFRKCVTTTLFQIGMLELLLSSIVLVILIPFNIKVIFKKIITEFYESLAIMPDN